MRIPIRLALALVASLTLAGAARPQDEPPRPSFPDLPAAMPAGGGMIQPCLDELEGQVRCGRYRVWEDRAQRSGRTIDLAFVIADALEESAAGRRSRRRRALRPGDPGAVHRGRHGGRARQLVPRGAAADRVRPAGGGRGGGLTTNPSRESGPQG